MLIILLQITTVVPSVCLSLLIISVDHVLPLIQVLNIGNFTTPNAPLIVVASADQVISSLI